MMQTLSSLSFAQPWLLMALVCLPVFYWLFRILPPAPTVKYFPAISLITELNHREKITAQTPWWLILLRLFALILLIIGFSTPRINAPEPKQSSDQLLILMDASWASAISWDKRKSYLETILRHADEHNQLVGLYYLSNKPDPLITYHPASEHLNALPSMAPNPWAPDYASWLKSLQTQDLPPVIWLSDNLNHPYHQNMQNLLKTAPQLQVLKTNDPIISLRSAILKEGQLHSAVLQPTKTTPKNLTLELNGYNPAGQLETLQIQPLSVSEKITPIIIDLPIELRNRLHSIRLRETRSAGNIILLDNSTKTAKIVILDDGTYAGTHNLLSPNHYLKTAFKNINQSDVIETDIQTALLVQPQIIVMADRIKFTSQQHEALLKWIKKGGILLRFAGENLVATLETNQQEKSLLPVTLRKGIHHTDGALSWGGRKKIKSFNENSPFFNITIPDDIEIKSHVLAQPSPDLEDHIWAYLNDATPLVTAKHHKAGHIILFHIPAQAHASNILISGMFLTMLERITRLSLFEENQIKKYNSENWRLDISVNIFGQTQPNTRTISLPMDILTKSSPTHNAPAGIYKNGTEFFARNILKSNDVLKSPLWQPWIKHDLITKAPYINLGAYILTLAAALLIIDAVVSLLLIRGVPWLGKIVSILFALILTDSAQANTDHFALRATKGEVLAYVLTNDPKIDAISHAGLSGLSAELIKRTSLHPLPPLGINIETDDISLLPFLYWPITPSQGQLSDQARVKINQFLRTGGLILFDTRDAHLIGTKNNILQNQASLRNLTQGINIPILQKIHKKHALKRSFYLLDEFPGRYNNKPLWVAKQRQEKNDNVSSVIIGAHDWASAWAIGQNGHYLFSINGPTKQREYAQRFGINIIMYALTGTYKTDQLHMLELLKNLEKN